MRQQQFQVCASQKATGTGILSMSKMQVFGVRGRELVLGALAWIETTLIVAEAVENLGRGAGGRGIEKNSGGGEAD